MLDIIEASTASDEEQALLDKFLSEQKLFLAPDPEIMNNHSFGPRTSYEDRLLGGPLDPHVLNHVRGLINSALDESYTMIEQMGAAPGAKWGDLVTAIFTPTGDLSMIAPNGIIGFASCVHYPIKFILKYFVDDETVGVRDGDAFIHNDARYGGIHNTDQSMMLPVYWRGELVCWVSSTIHEGENGATEPGGMPAAAESKYDEGLKMPPFKAVENFRIKRDLLTFLQNSVRDPKLQLEDMKVKLHATMRLRERVLTIIEQHGRDAFAATMRKNLEDTETEVRRRIAELPDGTTRVLAFMDSTLRENALQKIGMAVTVKGDRMTFDFRGCSPQFLNRAVNTNMASFKAALVTGLLQSVWPDLPHTMGILSPVDILSDANSLISAGGDSPQAMSLMPLFKGCVMPATTFAKLNYSLPHRYTAIIAPQYDQAATFIYGGLTQHGEVTGNFCADINGNGQGARSDRDGENSIAPVFGFMCDLGEHEIAEEDTPIVRIGAQVLAKDRIGFGKYRGGLGYEQVATVRDSNYWGFMTGCEGSKFSSTQGLFGGYSCPAYQLSKIKNVNVFEEFRKDPSVVDFDIVSLMNNRKLPGTYSVNDMGLTFELCQEGELYMICQGAGGGYGDVLEREPDLVIRDVREQLMSPDIARAIYHVVFDETTLVLDHDATDQARTTERRARISRGKPFAEFCEEWVTPEPPENIPYFGSWDDPAVIYAGMPGSRIRTSAAEQTGIMMPNPKDLRIAALEAEVASLKAAR